MTAPKKAPLFDATSPAGHRFADDHPRVTDRHAIARLAGFLGGGHLIMQTSAKTDDVVDGEQGRVVPTLVFTDGSWIWTAAHRYYLEQHGIALDEDFRSHIESQGFEPRSPSDEEIAVALDVVKGVRPAG